MACEPFRAARSLIRCADARIKLLSAAGFSIVVACTKNLEAAVLALLTGICMVTLAGLPAGQLLSRAATVNLFILAIWCIIPFTTPGHAIINIWILNPSREGLMQALFITLRCNAILFVNLALLSTSSPFSLAYALLALRVHPKLVHLFLFSWRYLHVLDREYKRAQILLKIRGFDPGTDLHTYKTYAYLVGILLIKGYDRANRVYHAMLCRGFDGTFRSSHRLHLDSRDMVLGVTMFVLITMLAGMGWILGFR